MQDPVEHVVIAYNPTSGSSAANANVVNRLRDSISEAGFQCNVLSDLAQIRQSVLVLQREARLSAVVSAGGDGTAEVLANLLPPEIPILPYPMGTENLLAKHLGITGDVDQTCDALQSGSRSAIDVGSVGGKLFLVMLSCGFDAEVVRAMDAIRKGKITRWSYFRPILKALRNYRFPAIPFIVDGESRQQPRSAAWIFVFNLPRYAARLPICPQADPLDGYLDVCAFRRGGIVRGLGYLARIMRGKHQTLNDFTHLRCQRLEIQAPTNVRDRVGIPYQVDGDPGGELPLSVEVVPRRLTLIRPVSNLRPAN